MKYHKVLSEYAKDLGEYAKDLGEVTKEFGEVTMEFGEVTMEFGERAKVLSSQLDIAVNIVIDNSDPQSPIFIDIENDEGLSIKIGEHSIRQDGFKNIRIVFNELIFHEKEEKKATEKAIKEAEVAAQAVIDEYIQKEKEGK